MRSLLVIGPLVQDVEAIYPFYRLQEEGEVDVLSSEWPVTGICGVQFQKIVDGITYTPGARYDLVVLAGGAKCLEKTRQNVQILHAIKRQLDLGMPVASICHGSQYLIELDAVNHRNVLGYYSIRKDIVNAGGIWAGDDTPYVIDGNIVSCAHYKFMTEWLKAAIDLVKSK